MQVVFFDSGVGGLTVLEEALIIMPNEHYVYFADTDNVPYGTKSKEEIKRLVFKSLEYFNPKNIKAFVLACNTATGVAVEELRSSFSFPIIGMEPAIKPATKIGSKKILVCATDRTLKLDKLNDLIDDLNVIDRVEKLSLQKLVTYAEHFDFNAPSLDLYLRQELDNIAWDEFDSLVLGCTHFLFFLTQIKKIIPDHINILDGNLGTVNRLKSLIKGNVSSQGSLKFLKSGRKVTALDFDHYIKYYKEIK